ncbi:hypothetical protein N8I77_010017 [Diaporthe amygdali]|uniref:15-cis-phytoene synthase n=1 Tax=Phomopsis amygdali TaxID=1214568 RepID=A0AAD9VYU2_PHOAM|nr:hypothetical protein N8I77_010017 [Diaporthe amygdali]
MADDLVDEPPEGLETSTWISKLSEHLDLVYKPKKDNTSSRRAEIVRQYITNEFPPSARSALTLLPASLMPSEPLYLLLEGFRTDSDFQVTEKAGRFPIATEHDLSEYGRHVAGTVGELCLALISHHSREPIYPAHREAVATAARRMGIALQFVNIARDIAVDAALGRVYLPTAWLVEEGLTPEMVIETITKAPISKGNPTTKTSSRLQSLEKLRGRLLGRAFKIYAESKPAMDWLPDESRRPMMVAVESYMEIGRVLLEKEAGPGSFGVIRGRPTRATVPKLRRIRVALRALLDA